MSQYNKFIVAAIGIVAAGINALYGANANVQLIISILTAVGVYQVPNKTN